MIWQHASAACLLLPKAGMPADGAGCKALHAQACLGQPPTPTPPHTSHTYTHLPRAAPVAGPFTLRVTVDTPSTNLVLHGGSDEGKAKGQQATRIHSAPRTSVCCCWAASATQSHTAAVPAFVAIVLGRRSRAPTGIHFAAHHCSNLTTFDCPLLAAAHQCSSRAPPHMPRGAALPPAHTGLPAHLKSTLALLNMPSFRLTTTNWLSGKCCLIMEPMFCVWVGEGVCVGVCMCLCLMAW